MTTSKKTGVLLVNTGSPDAPEVPETRRYLRQFLSDARVLVMSPIARWSLLNFIILPTRPKVSSAAYRAIWTDRGSPLIANSEDFRDGLRQALPEWLIEIGMAYGKPSVPDSLDALIAQGAERIIVAPMFPQYASATTGSVLELTYKTAAEKRNVPSLTAITPFYEEPEYLDAWSAQAQSQLDAFQPDHILFSFHSLPRRHIIDGDPTGTHCLANEDCCENYREANPNCYRAHCFATTRGIVERLGLKPDAYTLAFQSKLGRDSWLTPATDQTIVQLAKSGVKRLAILSPAFVADCIETLEELGMQGRDSFMNNGGEDFKLVTSLNSHPAWVTGFAEILKRC